MLWSKTQAIISHHNIIQSPKISSSTHVEFSGFGGRWWCTYKLDAMRIQKTRHIEQVGDFSHVFLSTSNAQRNISSSSSWADVWYWWYLQYTPILYRYIVYGTLHRWRWLWWEEHEMHFFLGKRKGKGAWEFRGSVDDDDRGRGLRQVRVIKSQAFDDIIIVVSIIPETIMSVLIFVGDWSKVE